MVILRELSEIAKGNYFLFFYPVAIIALLFMMKGKRKDFVVPCLFTSVIIVNPLFYFLWNYLFAGTYYWRIFWAVPLIPVCAAFVATLSGKVRNTIRKVFVPVCFAIIAMLLQKTVYSYESNAFFAVDNDSKLPQESVAISKYLLTKTDNPRIIADSAIGIYIRQYSSKISLLYGRDIFGFIKKSTETAKRVYEQVENPRSSLDYVAQTMIDEGYEYLVIDDRFTMRKEELKKQSFKLLAHEGDYGVYTIDGTPTIRREVDDKGRVISRTFIDENGNQILGEEGYSTIQYSYDDLGNIIREFRTDLEGKGVLDDSGCAGYERTFNSDDQLLTEKSLGINGESVMTSSGYAEVRRTYRNKYLTSESYYDENGKLKCLSSGYASVQYDYNGSMLVKTSYFDEENKLKTVPSYQYAMVVNTYKNKMLVSKKYFDENENLILLPYKGYAEVRRQYKGELIAEETYYDENGNPITCINGYSGKAMLYDKDNNLESLTYLDVYGNPTVANCGYARVLKEYDEKSRLIKELYYGPDGQFIEREGEYVGIVQSYDTKGRLVDRKYIGPDGSEVQRIDGYSSIKWIYDETSGASAVRFYDLKGNQIPEKTINLAKLNYSEWSDWMVPDYDTDNSTFYVGEFYLGDKEAGTVYTCSLEIEFKDVSATEGSSFRFRTQGAVDAAWNLDSIWGNNLIYLKEPPQNGIYTYESSVMLNMLYINASVFDIGFRCDNWSSGMFRVRSLKIEEGDQVSEWSPGL